jgi:transcriptional regulator GlxA family with amidase domain
MAGGNGGVGRLLPEWFSIDALSGFAADSGWKARRLAELYGMSLRQLERNFQEYLDKTPIAWMREVRCRKFAERMASGRLPKELLPCPELRFTSASHVCQEFRKAFGMSPKAYVRMKYGKRGGGQAAVNGCRF